MLRGPLENWHISISRAAMKCDFPAQFQLIAALNPCLCGYYDGSQPINSATLRSQVIAARKIQLHRQGKANAQLSSTEIKQHCLAKHNLAFMLY